MADRTWLRAPGKMPRVIGWGPYSEQRTDVDAMMQCAKSDFKYIRTLLVENLTNKEKMAQSKADFIAIERWARLVHVRPNSTLLAHVEAKNLGLMGLA